MKSPLTQPTILNHLLRDKIEFLLVTREIAAFAFVQYRCCLQSMDGSVRCNLHLVAPAVKQFASINFAIGMCVCGSVGGERWRMVINFRLGQKPSMLLATKSHIQQTRRCTPASGDYIVSYHIIHRSTLSQVNTIFGECERPRIDHCKMDEVTV